MVGVVGYHILAIFFFCFSSVQFYTRSGIIRICIIYIGIKWHYSICTNYFATGNSTTCSVPGYAGNSNPHFSAISAEMNLPPKKCRCPSPTKNFAAGLGAVRLINTCGRNPDPRFPASGGPESTSHDDGISIEITGLVDFSRREITASNGERIGGWNENPKIASRT